jgi:excisionase family DNA binding protein
LTISVAEAAAMLGLGLNQTYGAAERGDIPSIRIGGRILVPRAPFERLFAGG